MLVKTGGGLEREEGWRGRSVKTGGGLERRVLGVGVGEGGGCYEWGLVRRRVEGWRGRRVGEEGVRSGG